MGRPDIFVARDREAEALVGDVVSSRLVVLFAKTGTGKTSLINAGVRPRLGDLDYATFYVRVERDPVAAVRGVLRAAGVLGRTASAAWPRTATARFGGDVGRPNSLA